MSRYVMTLAEWQEFVRHYTTTGTRVYKPHADVIEAAGHEIHHNKQISTGRAPESQPDQGEMK